MRNLSLCSSNVTHIPEANVSSIAFDLDENILYVASEASNLNGELAITIWKNDQKEGPEVTDNFPLLVASFTAVASAASSSQIVSFRFIAETRRLVLMLLNGDINVMSPDEGEVETEVEGTFDSGISAASWSPDDSLVVLITGDSKLILMTVTFDVLSESPLHKTDFGEDAPINVGWGSKQTQFHGSLGKAAAKEPSAVQMASSPDDDTLPRIAWRGDGSMFAMSSLSPPDHSDTRRRIIRVYDRTCSLQSTSEPVPGLEHPLSWRPSGNLFAGTQRFGFEGGGVGVEGRHDVVFFERNGLQHGSFGLRSNELAANAKGKADIARRQQWGYRVRELSWSSDSNVLCVWIERDEGDIVQLWTTGNYHWYLKQEIMIQHTTHTCRFTSVSWHPEQSMHLILTTSQMVIQRTYAWECYASPTKPPRDSGTVAVIDGSNILLTPFRTQNVPPPMCSRQLTLPSPLGNSNLEDISWSLRTPIHASFSSSEDVIAILWENGHIELWNLHTRLGPGSGHVMDPVKLWGCFLQENNWQQLRQIILWITDHGDHRVVVLGTSRGGNDLLAIVGRELGDTMQTHWIQLPKRNGRLIASSEAVCWQAYDGEIYDINIKDASAHPVAQFPEFCFLSDRMTIVSLVPVTSLTVYIGLGASGRLHLIRGEVAHILTTHATSFIVTDGFCIFTTSSHDAVFAPLASLALLAVHSDDEVAKKIISEWEKRRVERGSRIVTAVPSTMSLVLQMPRGNLETISPRPLVMEVVKQDLDMGNYRKAFLACRKHRIDLNVLVEHNRSSFLEGLPAFVEQIGDVDHFNLFLTSLGRSSQLPEVIAELCDALRSELETKSLTKYINCIMTAYVVKSPPDHEAGLALLLRLRETDPGLVEDAVKYIIFLVDADTLFNAALGMYDFSLVLLIAQHAQKDPREYLPFLRELRAMDKYYQRFKIDDHLTRHEKALGNLSLAGENHFEEAMGYVERHRLYEQAISIWKVTDQYSAVLGIYGDWLFERRQFSEAAQVFIEAKQTAKALLAHERALEWRQLFDLAMREDLSQDEIVTIGYRVAEGLSSKKRYSESARVLLDYSKDVREAVVTLVQGNDFSEARRVVTLHGVQELLSDIIHPGSLDSRAQIEEDLGEMKEQLRKQRHRLGELRLKKIEEPESFFGTEDENLHNFDVMTDASMPGTTFTRYTAAPSAASKTSKRSSRSKRKMLLKAESGRKGTIHEEEYLLKSVAKLVDRFNHTREETDGLMPHLVQFTSLHRKEARLLNDSLQNFQQELREAIDEIWGLSTEEPLSAEPAIKKEGLIRVNVGKPVVYQLGWTLPLM